MAQAKIKIEIDTELSANWKKRIKAFRQFHVDSLRNLLKLERALEKFERKK